MRTIKCCSDDEVKAVKNCFDEKDIKIRKSRTPYEVDILSEKEDRDGRILSLEDYIESLIILEKGDNPLMLRIYQRIAYLQVTIGDRRLNIKEIKKNPEKQFPWDKSEEGVDFWKEIFINKKLEVFYRKYPINLSRVIINNVELVFKFKKNIKESTCHYCSYGNKCRTKELGDRFVDICDNIAGNDLYIRDSYLFENNIINQEKNEN